MGLFDKLFGGGGQKEKARQTFEAFKTLTAYRPVFTSWGGAIYENELVRSAIDAKARNISKLKVEFQGSAQPEMVNKLKHAPNDWSTWGQFLYRLSTILDVQNTAFIVPVFDKYGRTEGIYPVLPSRCKLVESKAGVPYIVYEFTHGETASLELEKVGILTRFQYKHDFFGEKNYEALKSTMELIDIQNQGIKEGVKSSATFRFMAQLNNFADDEDLKEERLRFNRNNLESDSGGLLLFPNTYSNVQKIDSKPFVIDSEQMRTIQTNVFNYFGVNEDILQNKAFGDAWSAFYEGAIEPFSIQFSEVVTNMLFTKNEQSRGALVIATANRLQYMTNADKLAVSAQMLDRGIMSRNEIREIWNLAPIDEGDNYIIRGEYYDANEKLNNESEEE